MKKSVLFCVLLLIFISCAGCAAAETPEVTLAPTAVPTQPHVCVSVCEFCSLCADAACAEEICAEKCTGVHQEVPYEFSTGDYITTEAVSIDTGTLVFDIGENVYVPGNLAEIGETIAATIEKVTGLDFDGAGYAREYFPDGKIHVNVSREYLYAGNPNYPWYQGLETSEAGYAYASTWGHVEMSPGDLFISGEYAVVHELAHVMMYRQSEWSHSQLLDEGFAEYTTYLALLELEETNPEAAFYLDRSKHVIYNMWIWDYEKLFEQPVEYWFENTFEYSGNANYTVGFRFMAYLNDVYGDYSKWITEFENTYNYKVNHGHSDQSSVAQQIEVLKATYGEDVLDNFYPWLKQNLESFDQSVDWTNYTDRKNVEGVNWYPRYNAAETVARIQYMEYKDLYINIETVRKYLNEYKQEDVPNLYLVSSEPVKVKLYQADGTYTTVMTNSQKVEKPIEILKWDQHSQGYMYTLTEDLLPLENVSYIKLVGEGELEWMEIVGDFRVLYDASA